MTLKIHTHQSDLIRYNTIGLSIGSFQAENNGEKHFKIGPEIKILWLFFRFMLYADGIFRFR